MPFDQIRSLLNGKGARLPAAVALVSRGGVLPKCRITLLREFAESNAIKHGETFDLLLGTGGDKRLLRLRRNKAGIVAAMAMGRKKTTIIFNLGHIDRFGTEPEPRERCLAEIIDGGSTIQITLPAWAEEQDS